MQERMITRPITVFYSYAQKDEGLRLQFEDHLVQLKRDGLVEEWYNREILAGSETTQEIDKYLNTASIILLLVSPSFLASDSYERELDLALARQQHGDALVIPIILRPCEWRKTPLGSLQYLPRNGEPVTLWDNQDKAFSAIIDGLRRVIEDLNKRPTRISSLSAHTQSSMFKSSQGDPFQHSRLRTQIDRTAKVPSASGSFPCYRYIPIPRNLNFIGREDILQLLHDTLHVSKKAALTQAQSYALSGLGGIGKTQTALEYAYRYGHEYETILWMGADTYETLGADARESAIMLGLVQPEIEEVEQPETALYLSEGNALFTRTVGRGQDVAKAIDYVQLFKKWLENNSNWLLVLDNVEDLTVVKNILPRGGNGHVLLTTRQTIFGDMAQPIKIAQVVPKDGARILLNRVANTLHSQVDAINKENQEYAEKLSILMDGLPLALDQAGAYIQETQKSVKEYFFLYEDQTKRSRLLQQRGDNITNHPESVTTTFTLSFEKIQQKNPIAAQLLQLCAFLHPDAIPEEIIIEGIKIFSLESQSDPLSTLEEGSVDDLIKDLLRYSLLHRNYPTKTYSIHRLLQQVLFDNIPLKDQQRWAEQTIHIVNNIFIPFDEKGNVSEKNTQQRSLLQLYLPHAQLCIDHIKKWRIYSTNAANLLNHVGAYMYQRRQYSEATQFYEQLLAIKKQIQGLEHMDVARNLSILANLIYLQKPRGKQKYREAEQKYVEALKIYEKTLKPDDPRIGQLLTHYAMLLRRLRRWKEAEVLSIRAKKIWRTLTWQEKYHWDSRWVKGNENSTDGPSWGLIYFIVFGAPIFLALFLKSSWYGWGSLALIILGSATFFPKRISSSHHQMITVFADILSIVGFLIFLLLSVAVGIAGWNAGNFLLYWFHLTKWSIVFQFILLAISAGSCFAIASICFASLLVTFDKLYTFPRYTIFPTLFYTISIIVLPVVLSLLFHAVWIFGGSFFILSELTLFVPSSKQKEQPFWRNFISFLFGIAWACLGWFVALILFPFIHYSLLLQLLPFACALLGFILGFFFQTIAYFQSSIIGAEGKIYFILEDLWVNTEVASHFDSQQSHPVKNWERIFFIQGEIYRQKGLYKEAITNYSKALQYAPDDSLYYRSRGLAYLVQNEYVRAISDLDQTIALTKNDSSAIAHRGETYRLMGRYDEALQSFDQAIALDENYSWAIVQRGETYRLMGRYDEALEDFNRVIAMNENSDWCYYCRAQVYFLMGQNQVSTQSIIKAIEKAQENLQNSTDQINAILLCFNIALYHFFQGNEEQARIEYDEVLSASNNKTILQTATKALTDLLTVRPDQKLALELQARIQARINELDQHPA